MGKFNCCYKLIFKSNVSNAWIHLHRCVEALARTKGESFTRIFEELENDFNFQRRQPTNWPDLLKIELAANCLKRDRQVFLEKLRFLVQERKREKKQGKRKSTNIEFLMITKKQARYAPPKKTAWVGEKYV